MKNTTKVIGFLFLLLTLFSTLRFANVEVKAKVDKKTLMKKISALQIPFIENQGQIKDKSVRFYANTFAGTVFVTDKGEIVYSLIKSEPRLNDNTEFKILNSVTKAVVLRESLECPEQSKIKGINKSVTKVNYFKGAKNNWRTNILTWQEVSLGEVYEGIKLKLRAYGNNVEKLFTVYPNANINDIKLKIEGAKGLGVNKNGELEIETELGAVKFTKPVAYQEIEGKKKYIQVAYNLSESSNIYGFEVEGYDNTKPLIIDPLLASTFIRTGSYSELTIDSSGDIFVAGRTVTNDIFISKLDENLSYLLSSTYIGGSSLDIANSIALDSSGNVFVTGLTTSANYPTTEGAYDRTCGIDGNCDYRDGRYYDDVFVSKLDNNLSNLLSSTFIGGNYTDAYSAITIDPGGNVFIAGRTGSPNYPTTPEAYDTTYNSSWPRIGTWDVFVTKLKNDLSGPLLASTYIGESEFDSAVTIALDSSGNVFVAGFTSSANYPTTEGAYNRTNNGLRDVFISKLDENLSYLLSSTYIGGSSLDIANSIALDSSGNVFVTGLTTSANYPTTEGAYDRTCGIDGNCDYRDGRYYDDVFVTKLKNDLSGPLLASTYIGGFDDDFPANLAIDSFGNVFVAGDTRSANYPTTEGAYDRTCGIDGNCDNYKYEGFISKLDSNLTDLLASTFIGGSNSDLIDAIAIDSFNDVFIAGWTKSLDYPTTPGAFDTSLDFYEVFVSKLTPDLSGEIIEPPQEFWAEISNSPVGTLRLRQTPGTESKPENDIIKVLPNGWVLRVLNTIDENGNNVDIDDYRWFKVEDLTDGTIGWMAGAELQNGEIINEFLTYVSDKQQEFEQKANQQLLKEERPNKIIEAVKHYYNNTDTTYSLYSSNDGSNNISIFKDNGFPLKLILAVAAKESDIVNFDNEWVAYDYGHGVMQLTTRSLIGNGSKIRVLPCEDVDRTNCYGNVYDAVVPGESYSWAKRDYVNYKYYVNTPQSLYANIKDGLKALQEKYSLVKNTQPKGNITVDEMRFISTVYRYNQGSPYKVQAVYEIWNGKDSDYIWQEYLFFYKKQEALNFIEDVKNACSSSSTFVDCLNSTEIEGLTTSAFYLRGVGSRLHNSPFGIDYQNSVLGDKLILVNSSIIILSLRSPGEPRIIDLEGRITGIVDGIVKEEIPNSFYDPDKEAIVLFLPENDYKYQVLGTAEGEYGLSIHSIENDNFTIFNTINIPIAENEAHQYTIDWETLSQQEEGVLLQIDEDGDGIFEKSLTSDNELTFDEFVLQTETTVDFDSDTLNLKSKGKYVTVYIELPAGYNVESIDISSILLNNSLSVLAKPTEIGDYDNDGIPDLMVKFDGDEVKTIVDVGEEVTITINGKLLHNGTYLDFKGEDIIKAIGKNK